MNEVIEISKIVLPALVVFLTSYMLLKKFLEGEYKKGLIHLKKVPQEKILPLKLQAYERLVLYLERISPNNLIMRSLGPGMNAGLLHGECLRAIREEFNHNLSQQIYVSEDGWELSKRAKEEVIKLLNLSMEDLKPDADAVEFGKKAMEGVGAGKKFHTQVAIDFLKMEVRAMF